MPGVVVFIDTESSGGLPGLRGEGSELLLNGCRGSVWEDRKAAKMDVVTGAQQRQCI